MSGKPLNLAAQDLEEAFFIRENARLLERLREKAHQEEQRDALRAVLPSADDGLLDHLIDLGIRPETALAVVLVPLTLVAWADGNVDRKERDAILRAAQDRGIDPGTPARQLLDTWLDHRPEAGLVEAWRRYVKTIWSRLDEAERSEVHHWMLGMARQVAEAAGGFLGLGSKISAAEQAVLDDLETTLT